MPNRALLSPVAVTVVLLFAGCIGFAPGKADDTTSGVAPTTSLRTGTTAVVPPPTDCGNVWVAFYAVSTDV